MSYAKWSCPDGGACHHGCSVSCYRVQMAEPLSSAGYRGDRWPADIVAVHQGDVADELNTALRITHASNGRLELRVVCGCAVPMTPAVVVDTDDPIVWSMVCEMCDKVIVYLLDESPDPCPFHTPEHGPHHSDECCYYDPEFDTEETP